MTRMCFKSPYPQGTGARWTGVGSKRYGKWEGRVWEAGGSDPPVPSPT